MDDHYRTGYYLGDHPMVDLNNSGMIHGKLSRVEAHQRMADLIQLRADLTAKTKQVNEAIAYYDDLFKKNEIYYDYEIWVHGIQVVIRKEPDETLIQAVMRIAEIDEDYARVCIDRDILGR